MKKILILLCSLSPFFLDAQCTGTVLVPQGSVWKYLDNGSDQGTAWQQPGFDDASWASGPAQLGYGDGDEATEIDGGSVIDRHRTSYFRHTFNVANANDYPYGLRVRLLRDDGAIIYLNGTEIVRDNMPSGNVNFETEASSNVNGSEEDAFFDFVITADDLVDGDNTLAVEVHQENGLSTDVSFDLILCANAAPTVSRGPYLQSLSHDRIILKWRTSSPTNSVVNYGSDPANLDQSIPLSNFTTEHEVLLSGLSPNTTYYYAVGDNGSTLAGADNDHYFKTAPTPGTAQPIRIWALGDAGTKNDNQRAVRDAFYSFNGGEHVDMICLLGDNAYDDGTDSEYQQAMFENMYEAALRNSVVWSCPGNHDIHSADSGSETGPYYDIFSFPRNGECGGLPSGTEAYYSFDYGNVHVIALDSEDSSREPDGAMLTWLENDLANTTAEWIVAIWHHPPYTQGSHISDIEFSLIDMRENALPILEAHGVDLVLCGHSHSYERSYLLNGHYSFSWNLDNSQIVDGGSGKEDAGGAYQKATEGADAGKGAVYIVAGSSGKISGGLLNHPAMYTSLNLLGSVAVDVNDNRMDVKFIDDLGGVSDYFTILKPASVPVNEVFGQSRSIRMTSVFPVPATDVVNASLISQGHAVGFLELLDVSGKRLAVRSVDLQTGNNVLDMNITHLPVGQYFLRFVGEEYSESLPFTKGNP
jgi:hypothetical protein